jgi:hypothetical protein
MAGLYAYSLEIEPTLFTVRLYDSTGSVQLISEISFVITMKTGIQHSGISVNGTILIPWYNVESILIEESDCIGEQLISIDFSDYFTTFKDVNLAVRPCIEDYGVNQGNYFTWFALIGTTVTDIDVGLCSGRIKECFGADISKSGIVNPYIKNPCTKHFPIVSPYEETTFYINFDTPIDSGIVNDYELGVMNEYNTLLIPSLGNIQKHIVNIDNDYVYYATDIKPTRDQLTHGNNYRFIVYDKSTNESLYISNPWKFLTEDVTENSTYLNYRSSISKYNFDYDGLPDFYNKIRLKLYKIGIGSDTDIEPYRSDTSGEVRNLESTLDKFLIIETYWFDELAQVATMAMNQHDQIFMNGVSYTIKTPFQPDDNPLTRLQKGTFEVYDSQFSRINKYC